MLLDTTFLVDILREEPSAVALLRNTKTTEFSTSELNVFELLYGAHCEAEHPEKRIGGILTLLSTINVLPLDRAGTMMGAIIAGTLHKKGKTIDSADCLIAGIAQSRGITTIITRNTKHFERVPGINVISY